MMFRGSHEGEGKYVTGTGQTLIQVHPENEGCIYYGCVIHQPSAHKMRDWPTHWRQDRQLMERICEHDVGHPDPDTLNYIERTFGKALRRTASIHGCDGCCLGDQLSVQ